MVITNVKAILLRCPCAKIADAMSVCSSRQALLVKIETDTELYGIGEAFCYGSPLHVGKAIIEEQLAPSLIGQNPENIEYLWQMMYWRTIANGRRGVVMAAISGVDIALWDLKGKIYNVSVSRLIGQGTDRIPSYASGGFYAPDKGIDAFKAEMESYVSKGYEAIKIKIGRNPEMAHNATRYMADHSYGVTQEEDLKRMQAARDVLGRDGILAVDINAAWPARSVVEFAPEFRSVGLNWLEEPIRFEDTDGCAAIKNVMPEVSLMGFETEQGLTNFSHMIESECVDIVQPDVGWGGGITELIKIGHVAAAHLKDVSLHSFGSAIHFAASLQLAATMSNVERIESEENVNVLRSDIVKGPFEADEHMNFYVPDKPGLGVEPDWEVIGKLMVE